jgi:hypothetical protein
MEPAAAPSSRSWPVGAGPRRWLGAANPAVARTLIAAVVGTLAGAVWSIMTSPVANESP